MENVKDWWFTKSIEEMSIQEIAERTQVVMDLQLSESIKTIPYIGTQVKVTYKTEELIALCPATGYPDIYEINIVFIPSELLPELKSLKFYFMEYLYIPISHEHLIDKIYQDFSIRVKPNQLHITLDVAIRGGIATNVTKGEVINI